MKTLELPEKVFEQFEAYRRSKRLSRAEALKELLEHVLLEESWWQELKRRPAGAPDLSDEEADRRRYDTATNDPLLDLIGTAPAELTDGSVAHDRDLYGSNR